MATPQSVSFHTLGCKLNFSETSTIRRRFEQIGYTTVPWHEPSDIYVLNTCSVTEFADKKCRAEVRKVLRQNEEAKVIVIGCYAQLKPDEIAEIPGVDLVLGAAEKFNVEHYIDGLSKSPEKGLVRAGEISDISFFEGAFSFGDRTRTFLKVQDGCDYKCSFCTIPQARGKSRSAPVSQIIKTAQEIADTGVKEIVLTGVNIGDYGIDSNGKRFASFIDLLKELETVHGIERIRISSIEPNLCSDEIIEFVSMSNKIVPHLHMPLQSGSNQMLSAMRRRYKSELYTDRVRKIKALMPHCCIGVDVIVGFPGETEKLYEQTVDFLSSLDISYLHVFTYSERANTHAEDLTDVVPMTVRKERNRRLRKLSDHKRAIFYAEHVGTTRNVLIESEEKDGLLYGFTDNYVKVSLPYDASLPHTLQEVVIGTQSGAACPSTLVSSAVY